VQPAVQAKLLQAIEQKAFMPVGGSRLVEVGTRVIAATNEDLQAKMRAGLFREDLYHRLNEAPIRVPPLRERRSDIPVLVEYFLRRFANDSGKPCPDVDDATMARLLAYAWPGNVRELSNCLRYGVLTGTFRVPESGSEPAAASTAASAPLGAGAEPEPDGPAEAQVTTLREARESAVEQAERMAIVRALAACHYNRSRAADALGISYRTLLRKISRYRISC
jgi:DNA-binding NtrC family response regulator